MQWFHLSQNNGSVCLHSEYPNWTVVATRTISIKSLQTSAMDKHRILPLKVSALGGQFTLTTDKNWLEVQRRRMWFLT